MKFTDTQIKKIKQLLAALKPVKVTLDGNRTLTVREAIFALAPTLERMKKRGFDTHEIVERLHEKGIKITPATLTRYLSEYRRDKKKIVDNVPKDKKAKDKTHPAPHVQKGMTHSAGSVVVCLDRGEGEL